MAATKDSQSKWRQYELEEYKKWIKNSQSNYSQIICRIQYFLCIVLPLTVSLLYNLNKYTLYSHISIIIKTCFVYSFLFTNGHVFVHINMLQHVNNGRIIAGWAYYHHYVNSFLPATYPYAYKQTFWHNMLLFNAVWYMIGINEYNFTILLIIYIFDIMAHEYYHSPNKRYNNYLNIFSSKFIGILYLFNFLNFCGVVNKYEHSKLHHAIPNSSNMSKTEDWHDSNPFIVSGYKKIVRLYGDNLFTLYKYLHSKVKIISLKVFVTLYVIQVIIFSVFYKCLCFEAQTGKSKQNPVYIDSRYTIFILNSFMFAIIEILNYKYGYKLSPEGMLFGFWS